MRFGTMGLSTVERISGAIHELASAYGELEILSLPEEKTLCVENSRDVPELVLRRVLDIQGSHSQSSVEEKIRILSRKYVGWGPDIVGRDESGDWILNLCCIVDRLS